MRFGRVETFHYLVTEFKSVWPAALVTIHDFFGHFEGILGGLRPYRSFLRRVTDLERPVS